MNPTINLTPQTNGRTIQEVSLVSEIRLQPVWFLELTLIVPPSIINAVVQFLPQRNSSNPELSVCQELRSFVAIENLTSYAFASESWKGSPGFKAVVGVM